MTRSAPASAAASITRTRSTRWRRGSRLEVVMPSTRATLRPAPVGDRRPQPGHVLIAEGTAPGQAPAGEELGGEAGRRSRGSRHDRCAARRSHGVGAEVARARGAVHPDRKAADRARGHERHRPHLRSQRPDGARRGGGARGRGGYRDRGRRPALAPSLRLGPRFTASVRKTNRVLCVNEDTEITNFGEQPDPPDHRGAFYELHAPPKLLAGRAHPGIGLGTTSRWRASAEARHQGPRSRDLARHEP